MKSENISMNGRNEQSSVVTRFLLKSSDFELVSPTSTSIRSKVKNDAKSNPKQVHTANNCDRNHWHLLDLGTNSGESQHNYGMP